MQQAFQKLPHFEHFRLHEITSGVYAAIGIAGGAAHSNAGIVDLGDCTLIFDTFETPQAAQDLRAAAEHLTERQATYVLISHAHADHWMGNQAFADHATIIATHETRQQMLLSAASIEQWQQNPSELEEMAQANEAHLDAETDGRKRASIQISLARWHHRLETLPTLELRFPTQTFDSTLIFHGTQRTAELRTLGGGHSTSDCFLILPAARAVFMGDLAFFQRHPFMAYCDPQAWIAQLEEIEQSNVEVFVPGHGPLGTRVDVATQKRYIAMLDKLVGQVVEEGGTVQEVLEQSLPEPFDGWPTGWSSQGMTSLEINARARYERLSSA